MRIFLKIEYDGTDFCGWQIQPNGISVQGELEKAIYAVTGKKTSVTGSGRTDSGVHAEGQVAHFDTDGAGIPPEKYAAALNGVLPCGIKIIESGAADADFHARFSAKRKTYRYDIYVSKTVRPLKDRYAVNVPFALDETKMNAACAYLIGKHDFRCFLASNSAVRDTVREIYSAKVERRGDDLSFYVCGNGFLYNMVRIIAGTLVKIGAGEAQPEFMREVLDGKDRNRAGKTMPARGLTLVSVEYD